MVAAALIGIGHLRHVVELRGQVGTLMTQNGELALLRKR
jgi:hypothetical protein